MEITVCDSDARVPSVIANFLRAEKFSQIGQFCVAKIVGRNVLFQPFKDLREHIYHSSVIMRIQRCI